jgi:hypothetical protein
MEDNQSVIKITHNSEDRKKIRYINIRYHFIRQFVNKKEIKFQWIQSSDQLADTLIKSLYTTDHTQFIDGIGLINELLDMEKPDVLV